VSHDLASAANWLHGVITTLKPAVSAFFSDLGAMVSNRPAPAGGVAVSLAVLVVLLVFIPKIVKKVTR
jgi:hypothetical protein